MAMERLHKFLAHCGVASRRKAEEYIVEGRVAINGEIVTELGVKIDPAKDRITVDGRKINAENKVYYLLHKPRNYTTTSDDEFGRKTVLDLMPDVKERVYPVGRLDKESAGLLVMTNDGDLAYFLTHPSKGVKKVYEAIVEGELSDKTVDEVLEKGVRLGPVLIKPSALKIVRRKPDRTIVKITVSEGVNREVRRLFAALGHEVKKLVRLEVGPLSLKGIARGSYRRFNKREFDMIMSWMERGGLEEAQEVAQKLRRFRGGRVNKPVGKPDPAMAAKAGARKKFDKPGSASRGAGKSTGRGDGKSAGKWSDKPRSAGRGAGKSEGKWSDKPRSSGRPAGKPSGRSSDRNEGKWSDKPRSSGRPSGKPTGKSSGKPSGKPVGKFDSKRSGNPKSSGKPTGKPAGRPAGKSSGKPAGKNFNKPAGKGPAKSANKGKARPAAKKHPLSR